MNYKKIYDQLVAKAKVRGLDRKSVDYYTEIHHIVPRSLGGSDEESNLVMLSAREHYIAHLLLWKMDKSCVAMYCAFMYMSSKYTSNSRLYELFKIQFCEMQSKRFYKKEKNLVGMTFGRLTVKELSGWYWTGYNNNARWLCECSCGNTKIVGVRSLTSGNTKSCGCLYDDYHARMSGEGNHFFGKVHTDETKEKIRQLRLSEEKRPWETNLAKRDKESLKRWSMSDLYYDIWIKFDKPGRRKLAKIYNDLFNDDVHIDYFKSQVTKFKSGWVPELDEKWLKFKNSGVTNE